MGGPDMDHELSMVRTWECQHQRITLFSRCPWVREVRAPRQTCNWNWFLHIKCTIHAEYSRFDSPASPVKDSDDQVTISIRKTNCLQYLGTPCRGGHFRGRAVLWLPVRPLSHPAILLWVNNDSNFKVWSVTSLMFPEMQGSLGALATTEDRWSSWREHKSPLGQDRQQSLEWGLQVWSLTQ